MPPDPTDAPSGAPAEPVAPAVAESPPGPAPSGVAEAAAVPEAAAAEAPAEGAAEPAPAEAEAKPEAEPSAIEAAAAEAKPEPPKDGEKPAEAATPDPFKFEDWTIPEGVEAAPEQLSAYNNILGKHGITQAAGQELLNFHAGVVKDVATQIAQRQWDAFNETNRNWVKQFNKEAGNQRDTVLSQAGAAVRAAFPKPGEAQAVWDALKATGAGNHPAIIKLLAFYGRDRSERPAITPPLGARQTLTPAQRRYRGKSQ